MSKKNSSRIRRVVPKSNSPGRTPMPSFIAVTVKFPELNQRVKMWNPCRGESVEMLFALFSLGSGLGQVGETINAGKYIYRA